MSFFSKFFTSDKKDNLDKGLEKTRSSVFEKITRAVAGKSKLDEQALDEIEEALIMSDVGLETTVKIIEALETRVARDKVMGDGEMMSILYEIISGLMQHKDGSWEDFELPKTKGPYVSMVVGVNGVGKTTTIGKLAFQFKQKGYHVVLGAADTFRAAAIEQLQVWGERTGVPVIKQEMGSDPASVAFDTLQHAVSVGADLCIIDTAGRLHNKKNLMIELSKVRRVMQKVIPGAPHEVLLVLDGSTGQNALQQAKAFAEATQITSLAVTKLDGTAKGGVVIGISDQLNIPVKFIGVGEGLEDLQLFNPEAFASSLFQK
ncbi:MAG TPA: signal recognition particle-docking protein FtsY [Cryomorphaceae bacterium]|nr:signal recognition particle-docking protein FtsY [Cryomorphaceae bacterium]HBB80971.1 signal recognition particle-docking protein FtsY [Cryomorphaceae bacterium]|tara:strand:- start:2272 stop:3225 length:954 start_codon:yes stop_codon:yes gene_type:complete